MFKNFRDKLALSGITVLVIGVALLTFTFVSAYGFLASATGPSEDGGLEQFFGSALAPLIVTAIRIMYLGVMGWIGSLITIRGVTIIANVPKAAETVGPLQPTTAQQEPLPQKGKAKPEKEAKPSEPEFVVMPPEEVQQHQKSDSPQAQSSG